MKIRRSLLKDQVEVATYAGEGAYGPVTADSVTVWCSVDESRRLVRDANGDETTSEATLTLHPRTRTTAGQIVDPLKVFIPESQVTINGRSSRVLAVKPLTVRSSTVAVEVTCA